MCFRTWLPTDAGKCAYAHLWSRLRCFNGLYANIPEIQLGRLQPVSHVKPVILDSDQKLQCPGRYGTSYWMVCRVWRVLSGDVLQYDWLGRQNPGRSPVNEFGESTFNPAPRITWNNLLDHIRQKFTIDSFKYSFKNKPFKFRFCNCEDP